jgi:signal transduction histidine kinase
MQARRPASLTEASDLLAELVLLYSPHEWSARAAGTSGGMDVDKQGNDAAHIPGAGERKTFSGLALIAAYEAALTVASEVRLEPVLQRIVDLARHVVPAKYAALGVTDGSNRVAQFIVSGLTPEEVERIGPFPEGHGLLGDIISENAPLLVPDISKDPRSVGFPPHHPPMRSLLGVPIRMEGRPLGNLYLADREDGQPFTDEDLQALQVLANHAAAAIDRAHLYRRVELGQQQAEAQLSQLRVILDNLPAGVLVMAPPDGRVELGNNSAIEMILGEGAAADAIPVANRDFQWQSADGIPLPRDQHPGMRALRGDAVQNQQLTLCCGPCETVPVLVQSAPLRDGAERIVGAVVVFQDVSRLRAAEQIKDDFLSLISHEFRTPLTAIHGGAHLLAQQGDGLDEPTRRELLDDIVLESSRLDRMLANLLSVAEIMAGRFRASPEPILIGPLVQSVIDENRRRAPEFAFALHVPVGLPLAEGDPELLRQILRNLYENAVKYSPNAGTIHTTARSDGRWVSIDVRDEGSGISPDHVPFVFERFRRPGADPTVRGMGLGLYLSRLLVEAQNGRIHASSPGIGKGASFTVELPVAKDWIDDGDIDSSTIQEEERAEAPDSGR